MDFNDIQKTYQGKRILITGHTGFKGSWLTLWLSRLGAEIGGFALDPAPEAQKLFCLVQPDLELDRRADIRDPKAIAETVKAFKPDFAFHLAAQPLVIESYRDPLATISTNVLGTANLLEAVRREAPTAHTIVVTTDKCYKNLESSHAYSENDALGGHDLYAASKAATEIITAAFNQSFFETIDVPGRLATARGGNVIGGGDYADNRIIPDLVKALATGQPIPIRNPHATRPWQHVLDCLSGYLALGSWLSSDAAAGSTQPRAFNIGPSTDCERTVRDLVEQSLKVWPGSWKDESESDAPHEASRLKIAIKLADSVLNWRPVWSFSETVNKTLLWYQADYSNSSNEQLKKLMLEQIETFQADSSTLLKSSQ
ncbi:MAG: CDP-glucose 4,6-dehydratase [Verrucomicrobiota bacterium]